MKKRILKTRGSGILLPIFSLPSPYGIGTFGQAAFDFVDFLSKSGQRYWQVLPIGPLGEANSPYSSPGAYAGNPYFIDLDLLKQDGLLTHDDYADRVFFKEEDRIDYTLLTARMDILKVAFRNRREKHKKETTEFWADNKEWLDDWTLFAALCNALFEPDWRCWPDEYKRRDESALNRARKELSLEMEFHGFVQYLFYSQWNSLKKYANSRGIYIIGDVPIYVSPGGVDVWSDSRLFFLDDDLYPNTVAGCPPDAFSDSGQKWGNPIYRWNDMKKEVFSFWIKRLKSAAAFFDVTRIDHFRGFDEYYAIPSSHSDAKLGKWERGPGFSLFEMVLKDIPNSEFIAEDLGYITPSVRELMAKCGYPGMQVLEFAFGSDGKSPYLPFRHNKESVVYIGTHDNEPVTAWFESLCEPDREFCRRYLRLRADENTAWSMIDCAMASFADTAIIQFQDILSLGGEARINMPGTVTGNWCWRAQPHMINDDVSARLLESTRTYGRDNKYNPGY